AHRGEEGQRVRAIEAGELEGYQLRSSRHRGPAVRGSRFGYKGIHARFLLLPALRVVGESEDCLAVSSAPPPVLPDDTPKPLGQGTVPAGRVLGRALDLKARTEQGGSEGGRCVLVFVYRPGKRPSGTVVRRDQVEE